MREVSRRDSRQPEVRKVERNSDIDFSTVKDGCFQGRNDQNIEPLQTLTKRRTTERMNEQKQKDTTI